MGDVAGMGADLFGSFAESTCAAMVIAGASGVIDGKANPLAIAAAAWPVGKMAAWTWLEGAPVDGLEEELGKVAVVEAAALLHLRDDPTERAGLVRLRLRRGDKRRRGDVVAAARRVLKRFAADEHTYVEVTDAASPKSVITQSRAVSAFSGPFTGISCRPCKN